mmetsp:Transcript_18297/g.35840  ORF Transcript_18297/g.35840 Transcript_18297/m.35840 type:complete len:153 (+) Transcript_18297:1078-1536(+)
MAPCTSQVMTRYALSSQASCEFTNLTPFDLYFFVDPSSDHRSAISSRRVCFAFCRYDGLFVADVFLYTPMFKELSLEEKVAASVDKVEQKHRRTIKLLEQKLLAAAEAHKDEIKIQDRRHAVHVASLEEKHANHVKSLRYTENLHSCGCASV